MHVVIGLRGEIGRQETLIKELSTRYLNFPWYNKETGKMEDKLIQMRVSPMTIWDISFPEQHKDAVLNHLLSGNSGKSQNKYIDKFVWFLRKCMRLKPIPEYSKNVGLAMKPPMDLEVIGIGVKDDVWLTEDGRVVPRSERTPLSWEGI